VAGLLPSARLAGDIDRLLPDAAPCSSGAAAARSRGSECGQCRVDG